MDVKKFKNAIDLNFYVMRKKQFFLIKNALKREIYTPL
jgi:hypothetical protein